MNVTDTDDNPNSRSESWREQNAAAKTPPALGRGRELLDKIPTTQYSSNWERQRQERSQRDRIARTVWSFLLVVALIGAVITLLRPR